MKRSWIFLILAILVGVILVCAAIPLIMNYMAREITGEAVGAKCTESHDCQQGLICGVAHTCQEAMLCAPVKGTQVCEPCGGIGQPACEGNICRFGVADDHQVCQPCGQLDHLACQDNRCVGWYRAVSGWCRNPFKVDQDTSPTICEDAELSSETRDWCRWHAAFYKNDLALCEQIGWGTMRAKCSEVESPEDYFSLPSFKP